MKRREFITLLGGAAAAWPLAARAQQAGSCRPSGFWGACVGFGTAAEWAAAFVQRLRELGWVRRSHRRDRVSLGGGTLERSSEYRGRVRSAQGRCHCYARTPNVVAAKQATSVIPIVFAAVANPVGNNLVAGLARPGGNVTGLSAEIPDLVGKRLELLREIIPSLRRLAIMANGSNPAAMQDLREVQTTGGRLALEVIMRDIRRTEDIAPAIEALNGRAEALMS